MPEAADEGYFVLYELEPPINGAFHDSTPVPYSADNRGTAPAFDRIAYYLELTRENETQWVYASMDAFSDDATAIGLPHNQDNPVAHQQNVRNMNVASNVPGIVTGTFMDGGHVEMWPGNYAIEDTYGVYASRDDLYDWGDGPHRIEAGYGTFQIHNPLARQTLLAYNHWGVDSEEDDDIGIGNQAVENPDWTFAENTAEYTQRRLVILVRPRTYDVSFTELPLDRKLYPRNPDTNSATVAVAGTESYGGYDQAVLRIYRTGVLIDTVSRTLDYQNGNAPFAFDPEITAQLAGYDFELLLAQGESLKTVELVRDVVAGDAFILYGQSNAEAASYDSERSANEYASQ